MGEFCRDQQIAPIFLCEIDRPVEPVEIAVAYLERGKLKSLEPLRIVVFKKRKIVAAFLKKKPDHLGSVRGSKEEIDATECLGTERGGGHAL
jgi:hypothetical protein